jgi:hypothetical protein
MANTMALEFKLKEMAAVFTSFVRSPALPGGNGGEDWRFR